MTPQEEFEILKFVHEDPALLTGPAAPRWVGSLNVMIPVGKDDNEHTAQRDAVADYLVKHTGFTLMPQGTSSTVLNRQQFSYNPQISPDVARQFGHSQVNWQFHFHPDDVREVKDKLAERYRDVVAALAAGGQSPSAQVQPFTPPDQNLGEGLTP